MYIWHVPSLFSCDPAFPQHVPVKWCKNIFSHHTSLRRESMFSQLSQNRHQPQSVFLLKETVTWRSFWRCWSGQWIQTLYVMDVFPHYTSQLLANLKTVSCCCWKQRQNLQQLKLGWSLKGLVNVWLMFNIFYLHICIPICLGLKDRKHSFTLSYHGSTCWGHSSDSSKEWN